jgi:hypothetical protein
VRPSGQGGSRPAPPFLYNSLELTRVLLLLLVCLVAACDNNDTPTPTTPANQPPAIAISSNTTFGITDLTTFLFSANAADPNGNPVTVTWAFSDGSTANGLNVTKTFTTAQAIEAVATAKDHTGLSGTSNTITVTLGTGTGTWAGTIDLSSCEAGTKGMVATFTQSRAILTGTISFPNGLCTATPGSAAIGTGGRILTSGGVRVTVRIGASDVSIDGQMTTNGSEIIGTVQVGDLTGIPFTLSRQ